jgi:hypothetical protein
VHLLPDAGDAEHDVGADLAGVRRDLSGLGAGRDLEAERRVPAYSSKSIDVLRHSTVQQMLWFDRATPFGGPVVPDV